MLVLLLMLLLIAMIEKWVDCGCDDVADARRHDDGSGDRNSSDNDDDGSDRDSGFQWRVRLIELLDKG